MKMKNETTGLLQDDEGRLNRSDLWANPTPPGERELKSNFKQLERKLQADTTTIEVGPLQDLTFLEAMALMSQGHKVKLPEWTGYWFKDMDTGKVWVFTRTGDMLDTPDFDKYNMREDWMLTDGSLGFDFATLALKDGKKVTRSGWNGKGMFIFMQKGYPGGIDANKNTAEALGIPVGTPIKVTPYLMMRAADGTLVTGWLASQTDMLATDWMIYQPL